MPDEKKLGTAVSKGAQPKKKSTPSGYSKMKGMMQKLSKEVPIRAHQKPASQQLSDEMQFREYADRRVADYEKEMADMDAYYKEYEKDHAPGGSYYYRPGGEKLRAAPMPPFPAAPKPAGEESDHYMGHIFPGKYGDEESSYIDGFDKDVNAAYSKVVPSAFAKMVVEQMRKSFSDERPWDNPFPEGEVDLEDVVRNGVTPELIADLNKQGQSMTSRDGIPISGDIGGPKSGRWNGSEVVPEGWYPTSLPEGWDQRPDYDDMGQFWPPQGYNIDGSPETEAQHMRKIYDGNFQRQGRAAAQPWQPPMLPQTAAPRNQLPSSPMPFPDRYSPQSLMVPSQLQWNGREIPTPEEIMYYLGERSR